MRKALLLALFAMAATLASSSDVAPQSDAQAERFKQYMATLKNEVLSRRDATLMAVVRLEGPQQKAFASLKDAYDQEILAIARKRIDLVAEFIEIRSTMSDEQARGLAARNFEMDRQRQELRERTFQQMADKISPVVAVQFLQVQGQFEALFDVERAKYVPLAGE